MNRKFTTVLHLPHSLVSALDCVAIEEILGRNEQKRRIHRTGRRAPTREAQAKSARLRGFGAPGLRKILSPYPRRFIWSRLSRPYTQRTEHRSTGHSRSGAKTSTLPPPVPGMTRRAPGLTSESLERKYVA